MSTRMGNTRLFHFFIFNETPYMKFVLQSSDAPENCGFTRWVDPAPIDSVQKFIEYLQIKIYDLECKVNHYKEVSEGNKDDEDDDTSNAAGSQDELCTIPYCNCSCHKKKGPAPPAPPPAPPAMGGYCGEDSTQFATLGYGY
ncbi:hypothetical protein PVAP13_3NG321300 [Panicum virgatum]|uniref:Uncharacterized protein n=1 Tax=Panicum virgatum TaxID=38727 RepID=A0A8T0UGD7_PANVG|nr:hypothetical protein PVAP13_3NG321300 [Panicum virgatum]